SHRQTLQQSRIDFLLAQPRPSNSATTVPHPNTRKTRPSPAPQYDESTHLQHPPEVLAPHSSALQPTFSSLETRACDTTPLLFHSKSEPRADTALSRVLSTAAP